MGKNAQRSANQHALFRSKNEKVLVVGDPDQNDFRIFPGYTSDRECVDALAFIASTHLDLPPALKPFSKLRDIARSEFESLIDDRASKNQKLKVATRITSDARLSDLTARGFLIRSKSRQRAGSGLTFSWMPELKDERMFLDYSLALLLDESLDFSSKIAICQLKECKRYFVKVPKESPGKEKTGRPSEYCCTEHRDRNIKIQDRERQRKYQKKARMKK